MRRRLVVVALVLLALAAGLQLRATRPVQAAQENHPEITSSLAAINLYRSWLGIEPLTIDPALQRAAEGHVRYYQLNFGDPALAGMGLHYQTEGKPGFTGVDFQDRADAAGYDGWVNENAGVSGSMFWSTDWFINTVGHRLTLLDPRYQHVGMSAIDDGAVRFEIIDLGTNEWIEDSGPEWVAWPPAGVTGVHTSFWGEAPNPFPGASYPVGTPITLKYFGPGALTLTKATLSVGGREVPSFAEIGTGWLSRETIIMASNGEMEQDATYTATIQGTANGQPFTKSWSFTTTNGNDMLALNGVSAEPPPADAPPLPPPGDPTLQPTATATTTATATGTTTATATATATATPTGTATSTPTATATPTIVVPEERLPEGVSGAHDLIRQMWWATDGPVAEEEIERSWLWGPDTWASKREVYQDLRNGERRVHYFDKARMEVNISPDGVNTWLTAGLIVRDMIAGLVQVGDDDFTDATPAQVPLAGDPLQFNRDAPTYASLFTIASFDGTRERAVPARKGSAINEVLQKDGSITYNWALGSLAAYGNYEDTLGHNVAAVFEPYLRRLPTDWKMSVGLPLAEPYWVQTNLAGDPTWVLVQVFERRVLTFTPTNRTEWQIEMGNVGRAYFAWRYGVTPPESAEIVNE